MKIDKITIPLTEAQYALVREALRAAEHVGDCIVTNMRVHFTDTEGVQATLNRLITVSTENQREQRTLTAVRTKINAAVAKALEPR